MRDVNWLITEMNIAEPEKLVKLRCPNYGLMSLSGIENFSSLEYLNCSSNKLKNLKGVESLSNLKTLIANDNLLNTISDIANTNIINLEIADNKLTSLDGIQEMNKLENIVMHGNEFDKILLDMAKEYRGIEKLKTFLKENPIYTSSKVGKLMKTGIFENLVSFENFVK